MSLGPHTTREAFSFTDITLDQFLAKIDYLACYDLADGLPQSAIGRALELRLPVFLPPARTPGAGQGGGTPEA